jgi:signal peptidase II
MNPISKHAWAAYVLAAAIVVADQVSKHWILEILRLPERVPLQLFGPFQLTRIWNRGFSFGLLQAPNDLVRWGMVLFSVAVAVLLALWARRSGRLMTAAGLGCVIGGALGNAVDRARFGAVVDFIDVQRLGFFPWIFNVADVAINVGVALLLLDSLRRERPA